MYGQFHFACRVEVNSQESAARSAGAAPVSEFTGERVIPGQVNDDLWAEHMARYAFAARFARGRRVLDLGCGTGYGTAELAQPRPLRRGHRSCAGSDRLCATRIIRCRTRFLAASATALPFRAASFDLVTAFEVIEHLDDWRALLAEARRVLASDGVFLVSTPNKRYYAESRGAVGSESVSHTRIRIRRIPRRLARVLSARARFCFRTASKSFAFYPTAPFAPLEARMDGARGRSAEAAFLHRRLFPAITCRSSQSFSMFLAPPISCGNASNTSSLLEQELAQNQRAQ